MTDTSSVARAVFRSVIRPREWAKGAELTLERSANDDVYFVRAMAFEDSGRTKRYGLARVSCQEVFDAICSYSDAATVDNLRTIFERAVTQALRRAGYRPPTPEHVKRWAKARMDRLVWRRRLAA